LQQEQKYKILQALATSTINERRKEQNATAPVSAITWIDSQMKILQAWIFSSSSSFSH